MTNEHTTSTPNQWVHEYVEVVREYGPHSAEAAEKAGVTFDPTNTDTYTCDACGQEVYEELALDHDVYCIEGHVTVIGVVGGGSA